MVINASCPLRVQTTLENTVDSSEDKRSSSGMLLRLLSWTSSLPLRRNVDVRHGHLPRNDLAMTVPIRVHERTARGHRKRSDLLFEVSSSLLRSSESAEEERQSFGFVALSAPTHRVLQFQDQGWIPDFLCQRPTMRNERLHLVALRHFASGTVKVQDLAFRSSCRSFAINMLAFEVRSLCSAKMFYIERM